MKYPQLIVFTINSMLEYFPSKVLLFLYTKISHAIAKGNILSIIRLWTGDHSQSNLQQQCVMKRKGKITNQK